MFDLEGIRLGNLNERVRFFACSLTDEDLLGWTLLLLRLGADGVVEYRRGADRLEFVDGRGWVGRTIDGLCLDERETDGRLLDETRGPDWTLEFE